VGLGRGRKTADFKVAYAVLYNSFVVKKVLYKEAGTLRTEEPNRLFDLIEVLG
jgi:acyl-CoA synthetase (NDP forming)